MRLLYQNPAIRRNAERNHNDLLAKHCAQYRPSESELKRLFPAHQTEGIPLVGKPISKKKLRLKNTQYLTNQNHPATYRAHFR